MDTVVGAAMGRVFRSVTGSVIGGFVALVVGAVLGAGVAGFLWYWSSVFRWVQANPWPPDEQQSVLAFAGVMGGTGESKAEKKRGRGGCRIPECA